MEIFEKLTKRRIKTFIEIQNSTKSNDFSFIRNKYLENEKYFEFVFDFLNGIGLFIRKNDEIVLVEKRLLIAYRNEEKLNSFLFEKTINDNSDFADYVLHYFQNFDSKNGSFVYKPLVKERLKESGLRNFLIDLDLVYHVRNKNCYAINEKYLHLLSKQIESRTLSPKNLNSLLNNQAEIGYLAELKIIEFEKQRLKELDILSKNIEHVAKVNVSAGFDIKSWETNKKERYIEVKAVSLSDYKFHWSRNEIEKSKLYRNQYYLYLLPVVTNNVFDVELMEIIRNPFIKIFTKSSTWVNQIEQFSFWKEN
ncbi:DUF3883 domain-containing protein [Candidatus Woesearchaeota archaeon]|jgi:hypothetical protein|nr:DUF3883 domain-containing protein [Candidatus Woesearchaeota archaeon]